MISDLISNDIPPQIKILNMVIPILVHFCSLNSNWIHVERYKPHVIQRNVTQLMMSNYFRQYITGYKLPQILRRRMSGAVKRDFRPYIQRYTSSNKNFEYGYPHSSALLQSQLKLDERYKPHVIQRNVTQLMMSNYFQQYITGYTVPNFYVIQSDAVLQKQVH